MNIKLLVSLFLVLCLVSGAFAGYCIASDYGLVTQSPIEANNLKLVFKERATCNGIQLVNEGSENATNVSIELIIKDENFGEIKSFESIEPLGKASADYFVSITDYIFDALRDTQENSFTLVATSTEGATTIAEFEKIQQKKSSMSYDEAMALIDLTTMISLSLIVLVILGWILLFFKNKKKEIKHYQKIQLILFFILIATILGWLFVFLTYLPGSP